VREEKNQTLTLTKGPLQLIEFMEPPNLVSTVLAGLGRFDLSSV